MMAKMTPEAKRQGWMALRSSSKTLFSKKYKWERRWFEVQGSKLSFSDAQGQAVLGSIPLRTDSANKVSIDVEGAEKRIVAITVDSRTFRCQCEDKDEAIEWVKSLRAVRDNKSGSKASLKSRTVVEVVIRRPASDSDLGFAIAGGMDSGNPSKTGVYVINVKEDGPADFFGGLEKGDIIVEVNGTSLQHVEHAQASAILQQSGDIVTLKVARRVPSQPNSAAVSTTASSNGSPLKENGGTANASAASSVYASAASSASSTLNQIQTPIQEEPPSAESAKAETNELATAAASESKDADDKPKAAEATEAASEEELAKQRAELKRRLTESRLERKRSQQLEVMQALSVIDDLPED